MKIAILNSIQLLENLSKENFRNFIDGSIIAVVSDNIKTDGTIENTMNLVQLMPQQGLINIMQSGDVFKFNDLYSKYLQSPAISVITLGVLNKCIEEEKDLVLLCSEDEDKAFGYLETVGFFLAAAYDLQPVPLKKIVKGKTKAYDKDEEELKELIGQRFAMAHSAVPNVMEVVNDLLMTPEERKALEEKRAKESKKKKKKKKK